MRCEDELRGMSESFVQFALFRGDDLGNVSNPDTPRQNVLSYVGFWRPCVPHNVCKVNIHNFYNNCETAVGSPRRSPQQHAPAVNKLPCLQPLCQLPHATFIAHLNEADMCSVA